MFGRRAPALAPPPLANCFRRHCHELCTVAHPTLETHSCHNLLRHSSLTRIQTLGQIWSEPGTHSSVEVRAATRGPTLSAYKPRVFFQYHKIIVTFCNKEYSYNCLLHANLGCRSSTSASNVNPLSRPLRGAKPGSPVPRNILSVSFYPMLQILPETCTFQALYRKRTWPWAVYLPFCRISWSDWGWGRPVPHPPLPTILSALMQIADRQTDRQAGRAGDKNVGHGEIRTASKSPQDTGAAGGQLCISRAQWRQSHSHDSPAAAG